MQFSEFLTWHTLIISSVVTDIFSSSSLIASCCWAICDCMALKQAAQAFHPCLQRSRTQTTWQMTSIQQLHHWQNNKSNTTDYGRPMAIIFLPVVSSIFYLSSFFLAQSQRSQIGCLPYFYTWCGPSANLECRSEMCCTRLAGNAGPQKSPKIRHLGTIAQLCQAISLQLRQYRQSEKNLLNSNIFPTSPHNMVNFGPLAVEIG